MLAVLLPVRIQHSCVAIFADKIALTVNSGEAPSAGLQVQSLRHSLISCLQLLIVYIAVCRSHRDQIGVAEHAALDVATLRFAIREVASV